MKKILITFIFLNCLFRLHAQEIRTCATMDHHNQLLLKYPGLAKIIEKNEALIQRSLFDNQKRSSAGKIVIIPVVFHVVYKTAVQNISDTRILEQLNVLNEDFARLNADTSKTPAAFRGVAANTGIQFCLAARDPNDNPTTGILRINTLTSSFIDDDNVKFTSQGGSDAWPRGDYLNIWVCNLGQSLLGYAQFPGGPASTDGVVVKYSSVGGPAAPGSSPFHLGRTATHEIGHWFRLYHTWGDSNCGSDLVTDTPVQQTSNTGCPAFPHITCSNGPNGDMFQNYMDYSNDACMNIFTMGQSGRMNAAITTSRASLLNSLGCIPLVLKNTDAGIAAIISPSGVICNSSVRPVVTIKNYGADVLTSLTINYQVDAGVVNTFTWTGSLVSGAVENVTLNTISAGAGSHTLLVYTSSPNSRADENTANDSQSANFSLISAGASLPFQQDFENAAFPPAGWQIVNPDASLTWERTTTAAQSGVASMRMANADYQSANGQVDEINTQPVDLTAASNPQLTFDVAYTYWTIPYQFSDTLQVLVSTNCGQTWSSLYKKWGSSLITAPAQPSEFIPGASEWRKETINLAAYSSSTSAIFKFRNITDWENNLYIDNINIDQFTSVQKSILQNDNFEVFPNPAEGIVSIKLPQALNENIDLEIYNSTGVKVMQLKIENYKSEVVSLDLSSFASGMYILKAQTAKQIFTQGLILRNP